MNRRLLPVWALCAGLAGCGDKAAEPAPVAPTAFPGDAAAVTLPADLPEDAVFLVEDKVITRAEIERWVAGYRTVEPGKSEHALRRFVVTNQNLPVVVAGLIDPLGREAALEQMQEARRRVLAGEAMQADGPEVRTVSGPWKSEVGLDRWCVAQETPLGEWSEIYETVGGFRMVRPVRIPTPWMGNGEVTLETIDVRFLPAEETRDIVRAGFEQVDITVIDEEWGRYLPTLYLYKQRTPQ
ncbi:MAG: hypothetical protein R3F17_05830 [Planctomycetota bacterium]